MSTIKPDAQDGMNDEIQDGEATTPSFCMLELLQSDLGVEYAFMYNGVRFYITIIAKDLEGKGNILEVFNNLKDDLDGPDTLFQFEEWILSPLQDFTRKEAPTPSSRRSITLHEYFSPRTFAFKFANKEGHIHAIQVGYDPRIHGDSSPRTQIVDMPNSTFQLRDGNPKDGMVLRSALPPVPLIAASELVRVDDNLGDDEISDIPKKVRQRSKPDHALFFKAGLRDHGHLREIELLGQIARSGNFEAPLRTSKLVGLVVWDDDPTSLMGLLLEYIEGETLQIRAEDASAVLKKESIDQVQETVKRLHEAGIIWGDVKPDNVMINAEGDVIVVDFGGGYTPEYIPHELQQTIQGDLMGLDHMRATLGL